MQQVGSHSEHARKALADGLWQDARAAFEAALAVVETPADLEGLGEALWWLCEARASVSARERAYVGYRQAGDAPAACRVAIDLSISYLFNLGNPAAARGWLRRAERLADESDVGPLAGWVLLLRGYLLTEQEQALQLFREALRRAREWRDPDLELVALSDVGLAMVAAGDVEEGLSLLDEAAAAALAGEYRRLETVVFTSCGMLAACSLAGDLARATQWCRVADSFADRYGSPFLYARCRVHYGTVLLEKGHWQRAENELKAALQMAVDAGPAPRAEALARLADLRIRQGRLEDADILLHRGAADGAPALPIASVRLARGEPMLAIALLERRLRRLSGRHIELGQTLALLVEAYLRVGDRASAEHTAARLQSLADAEGSVHVTALANVAAAHVLLAAGEIQAARSRLENALDGFAALELPLEVARVRLELARAVVADDRQLAIAEGRMALTAFERLGAAADADEAAAFMRGLGVRPPPGPRNVGLLTEREGEVLRLLATGLSNPEIAERLFISRKTVAHHVSSVLAKLGLRNRAEAVAYAARALGEAVDLDRAVAGS